VQNFLETGPSIAEIMQFFGFSRWPLPPSLIFKITKFFWANEVQRIETHEHVKFRQNWSFGCGDMKIFRFFKMAAGRHLGFLWGIFGPRTVSTWGSLSLSKI